jgi:hypothetical protein
MVFNGHSQGIVVALALLVAIIVSCKTEDCVSVANNDFLIEFYETDSTELKEVTFTYIRALDNDSIFYDMDDSDNFYALPVNPAADITTFIFQVLDSVKYDTIQLDPVVIDTILYLKETPDTIEVDYKRTQRIITVDCGAEISYNIDTLNINTFSGYTIENKDLSRFNDVNVKVFF